MPLPAVDAKYQIGTVVNDNSPSHRSSICNSSSSLWLQKRQHSEKHEQHEPSSSPLESAAAGSIHIVLIFCWLGDYVHNSNGLSHCSAEFVCFFGLRLFVAFPDTRLLVAAASYCECK